MQPCAEVLRNSRQAPVNGCPQLTSMHAAGLTLRANLDLVRPHQAWKFDPSKAHATVLQCLLHMPQLLFKSQTSACTFCSARGKLDLWHVQKGLCDHRVSWCMGRVQLQIPSPCNLSICSCIDRILHATDRAIPTGWTIPGIPRRLPAGGALCRACRASRCGAALPSSVHLLLRNPSWTCLL